MKNIYVVTEGDYSDYGIIAIRQLAQDFIDGARPNARIEEYPLDVTEEGLNDRECFFVRIDKNGDVQEVYPDEYSGTEGFDMNRKMYVHVFAKDAQHAIKIANERRAQKIALEQWPDFTPPADDDEPGWGHLIH
jgi:hypothetical protein